MSLQIIRAGFEKKLATMAGNLATAFENVAYTPTAGVPYQRLNLLPNTPGNEIQGSRSYFERGIYQITACFPLGTGPGAAGAYAQLLRAHFKRGVSMLESGVTVLVTDTPSVSPGLIDGDRYCVPVSIIYQAQILT